MFDEDAKLQSYIKNGKVRLVKGDGTNLEDVQKGWEAALEHGNGTLDLVLFSIGLYFPRKSLLAPCSPVPQAACPT